MLSRRWIINYVLVVLIVAFVYVGNHFDTGSGPLQPLEPITGLKQSDIKSLTIQTADSSLVLERNGSGWRFESPIRWPAYSVSIERLLNIVASETDSRLAVDDIDLAMLGLQPPKATIRLNDIPVMFGATNNIGGRRYTMTGSTVFLLPDVHLPFLTQGLAGMIDRRLMPHSLELTALNLPGIEITREGQNAWRSTPANQYRQIQVDVLVENWRTLEASRVMPYDKSTPAQQRISLHLENGQEYEYLLVSTDPEIIIANPRIGLQYHFPAGLYFQLISLRTDENSD